MNHCVLLESSRLLKIFFVFSFGSPPQVIEQSLFLFQKAFRSSGTQTEYGMGAGTKGGRGGGQARGDVASQEGKMGEGEKERHLPSTSLVDPTKPHPAPTIQQGASRKKPLRPTCHDFACQLRSAHPPLKTHLPPPPHFNSSRRRSFFLACHYPAPPPPDIGVVPLGCKTTVFTPSLFSFHACTLSQGIVGFPPSIYRM